MTAPDTAALVEQVRATLEYAMGFDVGGWPGHLRQEEIRERHAAALTTLAERLEAAEHRAEIAEMSLEELRERLEAAERERDMTKALLHSSVKEIADDAFHRAVARIEAAEAEVARLKQMLALYAPGASTGTALSEQAANNGEAEPTSRETVA